MISLTIFVLLLVAVMIRAYRNTFHPAVNHIEIDLVKERDEPSVTRRLRVLHLSDLHMENISVTAERIVSDLADQELDLIAITGDLLDRARNIPKAVTYVDTLKQLKPRLGIYVVFGNHDYALRPNMLAQLKNGLEHIGAHVLINETRTVDVDGTTLHMIGVDDYATRRSRLDQAFKGVGTDGIRLVLTHDPNLVLHMQNYPYDYLLSGHFHGGQIHWPKPFHLAKMGKLARMNMVKGLHYHDGRPFYISEGLGQTGVNARLLSRPEITIHTLAT